MVPPSRETRDKGQLLRIYSSSIYHITLPRIPNHLLTSLLYFAAPANTIPQQGIHTRGYSKLGLAGSPQPRRGGLRSPNRIVTPVGTTLPGKAWSFTKGNTPRHRIREYNKCFLVSRQNVRKHTNVGKSLELRIERVIYRVRQITHRAITKNMWDQVTVTMLVSKLKMNTRTKHIRTRTQSL
jgi:hypothetical protein